MKNRLQELLVTFNLTATRFADEIQVQRSGISHILSGRNQPSFDFITRLLNRYPQINARWLLLGEGEMLTKNDASKSIIVEEKEERPPNDQKLIPENFNNSPVLPHKEVTNVNYIKTVILLRSDGTFEVYNPGSRH